MTDDMPKKPSPKPRRAAQPKTATEAAAPSKPSTPARGAAARGAAAGEAAGGDAAAAADTPSRPLNRHERRSVGKKRPGQPAFKWPPTGPDGR